MSVNEEILKTSVSKISSYPLNRERHTQMRLELATRRAQALPVSDQLPS